MITGRSDMRVALIGRKLAHSFSPRIHAYLADYSYSLVELEPEEVGGYLEGGDFDALNVTIPYKKTVLPFLSEISEEARRIGSVNTITRTPGGLRGDNTDYSGFLHMLRRSGIGVRGAKALVLGSGGAAVTVRAVLEDEGARVVTISRGGDDNYGNLARHADAEVVVNTTPVGMYPDTDGAPLSLVAFPACRGVLDLIYNPARTTLLCEAERLGIPRVSGLPMLAAQAKSACELFCRESISDGIVDDIVAGVAAECENIVLIGMPGCGKTTVARLLADKLGKIAVDTDEMVASAAGMNIPDIFARLGEDEFRRLESAAVAEAGRMSGAVIATGGGIVGRAENYLPLHRNGRIVFMKRAVGALATDGRPLSATGGLDRMYRERLPLYEAYSDVGADVDDDPEVTAERILQALKSI